MAKTYVLYHANCPDGLWAAYAAWRRLSKTAKGELVFIPVSYGKEPPEMEAGSMVYILDFSYKRPIMEMLQKKYYTMTIDHHKTAKEELDGLDYTIFDLNHSGAALAWSYFNSEPVPELILYVEDRDLWKWELPYSREINEYLSIATVVTDFEVLNELIHSFDVISFWTMGTLLLKQKQMYVDRIIKDAFFYNIAEYNVPVVNSSILQSEVGEALCMKYPDAPFAGVFYIPKDFNGRIWSLRSRNGFDCSSVAKQFGGGGHPGAAGFKEES